MGLVAALLPHSARQLRLRAALRGSHAIETCADWTALTICCAEHPVHLAVIDLFATGTMSLEPLRQLKRRFPRLGTVAYVSVSAEHARDLFDAGRAGMDALIVADQDDVDPALLRSILEQAEARGVAGALRTALEPLRTSARDAVLVTVTRAHERLTTHTLAQVISQSRRVLAKQLGDAGLPPPQRLITWGRLIVAAHLMEDRERSADSVATALHFPSGSAYRNTCQRYLKATPSEIRARGGADWVIRQMLARAKPPLNMAPPSRRKTPPSVRILTDGDTQRVTPRSVAMLGTDEA
jgi:AraC-like DNA-binding protein